MNEYAWKNEGPMHYYYRAKDGKILGSVWQYVNNNTVWSSKILTEEFPFTNSSEKHLGQYINQESAKQSVELYWLREDNTLLENK